MTTTTNNTSIDLSIRGGRYQAITSSPSLAISGGNTEHPRLHEPSVRSGEAVVGSALEAAGFVRRGDSPTWYHVARLLSARVCHDGIDDDTAPKGAPLAGTMGVEIWDEPDAARLLGGG